MRFCFVRGKSLFTQSSIPVDAVNVWWMSRISANGLNGFWAINHWCGQTLWDCSSQWVFKSPLNLTDTQPAQHFWKTFTLSYWHRCEIPGQSNDYLYLLKYIDGVCDFGFFKKTVHYALNDFIIAQMNINSLQFL